MPYQLRNSTDAGQQITGGQGLRFVKDDHAVCNVVQLTAAAAAVGVQRFKKLYRSGHHNRCIPVFAGQQLAVLCRGQLFLFKAFVVRAGVIRQYIFCAQKVCKNSGSLVDDGHIRNNVDHPFHTLRGDLFQRKGKGGKGLAAAGGHGKSIQTRCAVGTFFHAGPQHSIALAAYRRGALHRKIASRLGAHLFQQRR